MRFDDIFEVVEENDEYIFLYCDIEKKNELLEKYFEYFFDEKVMYQHFNYLYDVPFNPTRDNYVKLYYELKKFIDDYNFSWTNCLLIGYDNLCFIHMSVTSCSTEQITS